MRNKKVLSHIQLYFLAGGLQELHALEVKAAEKFPLRYRGATVPGTLLATKKEPKPIPQTAEQIISAAMDQLVPGRFSHIVVAKKNTEMRQRAVSLKKLLKKEHSIEIGILAL